MASDKYGPYGLGRDKESVTLIHFIKFCPPATESTDCILDCLYLSACDLWLPVTSLGMGLVCRMSSQVLIQALPESVAADLLENALEKRALLHAEPVQGVQLRVEGDKRVNDVFLVQVDACRVHVIVSGHVLSAPVLYIAPQYIRPPRFLH